MTKIILALSTVATLAACQGDPPMEAVAPELRTMLAGKTFVHPDVTMVAGADGTLTGTESDGTALVGTWTITDGQWCRTLTAPANFAGTACQDVTINGNQATFTRADGTSTTYTVS